MSTHTYNRQGWKHTKRRRRSKKSKGIFSKTTKKNLFLFIVAGAFAGSLVLLGFIAFISRDLPNPDSLTQRTISQTTKIYDRTGEHILYEIFGDENRTLKRMQEGFCGDGADLDLDENGIPLFAAQATIAAEDHSFCEHSGFDVKGFMRAVLQNLMGNRVGGSTLTQQLVKNAILSSEKTITRKIKELILSLELERRYSKDEMLQIYLNEIPYGSTYYGIEAAAQNYFDTSVNELSLAQAATLASLPKATTFYLNNPDRLQARRDYILSQMLELGFISQEDHDQALLEETPVEVSITNISAPHFVLYVKEQLEETYGRSAVEQGGLKVITTLDYDLQQIGEEEVLNGVNENKDQYGLSNGALVAMDPKTGQVLTMVGSKNFFDEEIDGQVNIATRLRQPGSSFKPIVFAKGFEFGYTPNTVLWDVETTFPTVTGAYTPRNYDLGELGPIRVRDALQRSLNIPAVKMVYLVGVENTLDFATSLGYSSFGDHSAFGLAVVLGGGEVKLLEHTNAYATFANDGVRHDPVTILRVEDSDGTVLEEWKESNGKKIVSENVARTLTHVLKDNNARTPVFGENNPLQLGDRPVAAKTGTTNDYRDGWLMGYTPSLAVGVWVGNNDNTPMNRAGGSVGAGPIWNAFMREAFKNSPIEYFPSPSIEQTGKAMLDGNISSTTVVVDRASGKLATEYTPDTYREERMYAQYHSILHYVDRSDPRGDAPENPGDDPMYEPWETAIQTWIANKQEETGIEILNETPPTEEDDLHVPENFPRIDITSPRQKETIDDRQITIRTESEAPRGVDRVEFYIDGQYLGSDTRGPFSLTLTLPSTITSGVHTLKAIAYDDIDNSGSDTVTIQLNAEASDQHLELIDPKNGQTIERSKETYTIVTSLKNPEEFSSIRVTAEDLSTGNSSVVDVISNPTSPFLTFDWILPDSGTWALSAQAVPKDGSNSVTTTGILVQIVASQPVEEQVEEPADSADAQTEEEPPEETTIFTPETDLNLFGTEEN